MSKIEVRRKLRNVIEEMLITDLESGRVLPDCVCDYMLENRGWAITHTSNEKNDLEGFIDSLRKWVEDRQPVQNHPTVKIPEIDWDLSEVYKKYVEAESEYCRVTSELINVLQEATRRKEKYSEYFKTKCQSQEMRMNILVAKAQVLKLQFYLKLYGEENVLSGHLALESKLRKEVELLKKSHKELEETNKQYDEIKNDESFCEMFKVYKELKNMEKRMEVIGSM